MRVIQLEDGIFWMGWNKLYKFFLVPSRPDQIFIQPTSCIALIIQSRTIDSYTTGGLRNFFDGEPKLQNCTFTKMLKIPLSPFPKNLKPFSYPASSMLC